MSTFKNRVYDLIGQRFGRLIESRHPENSNAGKARWNCKCDCGGNTISTTSSLTTGSSRSCGCLRKETISEIYRKKAMKCRPYNGIYNILTGRAMRRGIFCDLTYEQFVELTKITRCYYCGNPIEWVSHHTKEKIPSRTNIDRIDSREGYTKDNCVVCCPRCNVMKNDLCEDEFYRHINQILKWQIKNKMI